MLYSSSNFHYHSTSSSTKGWSRTKKCPLDQESKANISWAFSFWSPFSSKCLKTSWKLRDFGELVKLEAWPGWMAWFENLGKTMENTRIPKIPQFGFTLFGQSPIKKMAWLRSYDFPPMVLKHFRPRRIRIIRDQKTAPVKVSCAWDIPGRSLSIGHNFIGNEAIEP